MSGSCRRTGSAVGFLGRCFRIGTLAAMATFCVGVQAQAVAAPHQAEGCTLQKRVYSCNWDAFRSRLDAAQTIAVESQPMDRFTAAQLRKLVARLGKSVAGANQVADLTFILTPVESTGIHIGPAGEPVATLRIYASGAATGTESSRGTMVWAETWIGHSDRPWPSIVHSLIMQFEDRFGK